MGLTLGHQWDLTLTNVGILQGSPESTGAVGYCVCVISNPGPSGTTGADEEIPPGNPECAEASWEHATNTVPDPSHQQEVGH